MSVTHRAGAYFRGEIQPKCAARTEKCVAQILPNILLLKRLQEKLNKLNFK